MSEDYYYDDPIEDDNSTQPRKFPKFLLIIILIFGVGFYLQSTLAANVTINTGQAVEFGQGYTATTSCAGSPASLKITPLSNFVNSATTPSYFFKSIKVENVPAACQGVDFTFAAYNSAGNSSLPLFDSTTISAVNVTIYMTNSNKFFPVNSGDVSVTTNSSSSFTLSFDAPSGVSGNVAKLALQSAAHNSNAGLIWSTTSNVPASSTWNSVIYDEGLFVAVGTNTSSTTGQVMYSSDGINWTLATGVPNHVWNQVTYGNGRFVATASSGSYAMYSDDGITWNASSTNLSSYTSVFGAAFGNGKFVASYNGGFIYSSDGSNWSAVALSGWRTRIAFGNGFFVAVGNSSNPATSADGINWNVYTDSNVSTYPPQTIGYGNGTIVAIPGAGGARILYSTNNGVSWSVLTTSLQPYQGIIFGNGIFAAIGNDSSSHAPQGLYSNDGVTWTAMSGLPTGSWDSVAYGNAQFVAVASTGQVMYSN
jgi:hypothetical protein